MPERLFSAYQVSDLLGVSPAEVAQWIHHGKLLFQRMPDGAIRIRQADLMQFLREQGIDIDAILSRAMASEQVRSGDAVGPQVGLGGERRQPAAVAADAEAVKAAKTSMPPSAPVRPVEPLHVPQSIRAEMESIVRPAGRVDFSAIEMTAQPKPMPPASREISTVAVAAGAANSDSGETMFGDPAVGGSAGQIVAAMLGYIVRHSAEQLLLEQAGGELTVRVRMDGQLHRKALGSQLNGQTAPAVMSHLCRLANLAESSESARSGEFAAEFAGGSHRFNLTTCPTISGRRLSIEPLRPVARLSLAELGMSEPDQRRLAAMLNRPAGLILVVGSPRSGASATLGAMAAGLFPDGRDIVEISRKPLPALSGVSQLVVGVDKSMSFAQGIEAAVAQRADVLVLHGLRDPASVRTAWREACDSRLVLAGLRANDWTAAVNILLQTGADKWEMAESLWAVVRPQVVRRLCPHCRTESPASSASLEHLGLDGVKLGFATHVSAGCAKCAKTGFAGRTAIFSMLFMDDSIRGLLRQGADIPTIAQAVGRSQTRTLVQAGMEKVRQGELSVEELARVISPGT